MKKNNKHAGIPAVALLLAAVLLLLSLPIGAEETDGGAMPVIDHCIGAYLYNFENDEVLYSVGADERVYPTSTVKLMTGIVAIEELGDDLSRQVTITAEMLSKVAGNNVGLLAGEVVTVEQLLYAMLVNSANDAAMVLAYAACGSVEAFVERMNEKANTLGAYDTYYANPTGMHNDAMVTTVADTAIIAKYAYTLPLFMEIVSTPKYVMEATNLSDYRNIYNRNCLLSKYYNVNYPYPRATGMNAGATTQGGYAICATAEESSTGLSYLAIVMGADEEDGAIYSYVNAIKLFEWAFQNYDYIEVLSADRIICELPVRLSSTLDYVTLVPSENIEVYLPTTVDVERDIRYSYNTYADTMDAPIATGEEAGTITVLMGERILGSCTLVTTSSVARSEFLYFLARVRQFSQSRFFIATVVAAVVLSIVYVLLKAHWREKHIRSRMNRR
ncbi:MAG: serine hydrolase [Eubacteriales bacterium]|nr:serine hydrolase [Clostridiales bacterium]MDY3941798.1 serine hydrolase [Eubacteriales bacterium]